MVAVIRNATGILGRAALGPRLMFVGGDWVKAQSGSTLDVFDPVIGESIVSVPACDGVDVDRAAAAATRAFESRVWLGLGAEKCAKTLWRVAQLIDHNTSELYGEENV
jgi:phenylacetaldehyde dehydrogenase